MSTKTRWTLNVDESGDFDSLDAAVAVGGMLHAGNFDQVAYVASATSPAWRRSWSGWLQSWSVGKAPTGWGPRRSLATFATAGSTSGAR